MLAEAVKPVLPLRQSEQAKACDTLLQSYIADLLAEISETIDSEAVQTESEAFFITEECPENFTSVLSTQTLAIEPSKKEEVVEAAVQCLLFSVGAVKMAIPLKRLSRVQVLQQVTAIVPRADIYCGLLYSLGQQVRVVDTQRLIMPERYDAEAAARYSHVIVMESAAGPSGVWGLAVNEIAESVVLEPGDIQWRKSDSKHPWLAGILRQCMCVLLDVDQLDKILTV